MFVLVHVISAIRFLQISALVSQTPGEKMAAPRILLDNKDYNLRLKTAARDPGQQSPRPVLTAMLNWAPTSHRLYLVGQGNMSQSGLPVPEGRLWVKETVPEISGNHDSNGTTSFANCSIASSCALIPMPDRLMLKFCTPKA